MSVSECGGPDTNNASWQSSSSGMNVLPSPCRWRSRAAFDLCVKRTAGNTAKKFPPYFRTKGKLCRRWIVSSTGKGCSWYFTARRSTVASPMPTQCTQRTRISGLRCERKNRRWHDGLVKCLNVKLRGHQSTRRIKPLSANNDGDNMLTLPVLSTQPQTRCNF